MYRIKKMMYLILVFGLLLLILLFFWSTYAFDVDVKCAVASKRSKDKILIVSYSVRPKPKLGPHIGGTARYDAMVYADGKSETYLLDETFIGSDQRQRLCNMSLVDNKYMMIHPLVNLYNSSQLSNKISLLKKVGEGDTVIFDGKQWYYTKIELQDDANNKKYILGGRKLTRWITADIEMNEGNLIAVQVAGYQDVVDELGNKPYMPYPANNILDMYAYEEPVDFGEHGTFPELKPVVQRRLASSDIGLSWIQLDWKVLDEQRVQAGSKLSN